MDNQTKINDQQLNTEYELMQDGMYYPVVDEHPTMQDVGRFGKMKLEYMQQHHPFWVIQHKLAFDLIETLMMYEEQAQEMLTDITYQMKKRRTMSNDFFQKVSYHTMIQMDAEREVIANLIEVL